METGLYFPTVLDFSDSPEDRFVHYSAVGAETPLRLIQFGTMTPVIDYGFGPAVREHHLLHFVFSGQGYVSVAGKRFLVNAGEVFFIPRDTVSYYEADGNDPWQYAWVGFMGTAGDVALSLARLSAETPVASIADPQRIRTIINDMDKTMFTENGYFPQMSGLYAILDELTRVSGRNPYNDAVTDELSRQSIERQLNLVINRVEKDFDKPISVQELADEAGITRGYLAEIFKKRTGRTVKEYITELRMNKARMLLTQTTSTAKHIAGAVGYDDPLYFSRIFKKYEGTTPTEYREKHVRK